MPNTPVAIAVPNACATCGRPGTVSLQHTIKGSLIALQWRCSACEAEWPVTRKEETPPAA